MLVTAGKPTLGPGEAGKKLSRQSKGSEGSRGKKPESAAGTTPKRSRVRFAAALLEDSLSRSANR
jgi:hypothetical protein